MKTCFPGPWRSFLNLAAHWQLCILIFQFPADFRPIFGQTWPPNLSRSTGLVLQCRLHHKSAPQTNILRPFRGTNNFRPDCLQVPRCPCRNGTFYCDSVCQHRHWPQHRREGGRPFGPFGHGDRSSSLSVPRLKSRVYSAYGPGPTLVTR